MSRVRTFERIEALRRGGQRSGCGTPRGPLQRIVGITYDEATGAQRLHLECGHITRAPYGPFGSEHETKREGDRRQCVQCRKEGGS